jgi:uncharacterized protein (TIGR03435 family)
VSARLALFLVTVACFGQESKLLVFEVASVKPIDPHTLGRRMVLTQGRDLHASVTLFGLIQYAYDLQGYQIAGGPSWVGNDFYDIAAKAEGEGKPTTEEFRQMLRNLIADRFQLKFRREIKELPVYELVLAKGGPTMRQNTESASYRWGIPGKGQWDVTSAEMQRLASSLAKEVGRTVLDMTGLKARYDFKLEWMPEDTAPPDPDSIAGVTPARPSIFTAVQEQLGLKLEPKKDSVEMLIIESVERPVQ